MPFRSIFPVCLFLRAQQQYISSSDYWYVSVWQFDMRVLHDSFTQMSKTCERFFFSLRISSNTYCTRKFGRDVLKVKSKLCLFQIDEFYWRREREKEKRLRNLKKKSFSNKFKSNENLYAPFFCRWKEISRKTHLKEYKFIKYITTTTYLLTFFTLHFSCFMIP